MKTLDITPIKYENNQLFLLDQTKLPNEEVYIEINNQEEIFDAIKELQVRGAPAIGVAAAYGFFVELKRWIEEEGKIQPEEIVSKAQKTRDYINGSRPTAVNLQWALDRVLQKTLEIWRTSRNLELVKEELLKECEAIKMEDEKGCYAMGEYGLEVLKPNSGILTHCNAGTIATAKYGTCLAPIHLGQERGYGFKVFADETRPLLQGARLTAWELSKAGVDVTLICDNMAASVMKDGLVDAVVVGCDRMAANGDGANKIGTLQVAIMAKTFNIPFYMFVPTSTIDMKTLKGDDIKIELRKGDEIYKLWYERPMAPKGIKTFNPSFDVTPAEYITAIVTEKGIVRPPFKEGLRKLLEEK